VNSDNLVLISVDDHVVEPPDLFEGRLPRRFADRAPYVKRQADGSDVWFFEGERVINIGLAAVAGRDPSEYGMDPTSFDEMRAGCFDVHERIHDMNANGVLASLCFPSFPQFCGQLFSRQVDKELSLDVIRSYNDWHLEAWCGAYPGRFIPLGILPLWDSALMAEEVKRLAQRGCHAVTFSENPEKLGYPSFHSETWDPFWAACVEFDVVVCIHIGSSSSLPVTSTDAPPDVSIAVTPMNLLLASADLLWSHAFRAFPNLKIALSEGGIGWIPYFLERADYVYDRQHLWTGADFGDRRPSDVFRQHFTTCFIDDRVGLDLRDQVGLDTICWECDYPHSDSTWPRSPEILFDSLGRLSEKEINAITHENAIRIFSHNPFKSVPRKQSNVASLRALSPQVDLSLRSFGRRLSENASAN
jgi:predicted TIM-barrel fold metal-dependent hydrolase